MLFLGYIIHCFQVILFYCNNLYDNHGMIVKNYHLKNSNKNGKFSFMLNYTNSCFLCSLCCCLVTKWVQVFCKAPLSMGLPKQENWNELLFPPPGNLPNPGIETVFPADSLLMSYQGSPYSLQFHMYFPVMINCIYIGICPWYFPEWSQH